MDPIGFNPPVGGYPSSPSSASGSDTSAAARAEDLKIAALYSGKKPVYQGPDTPSVAGTAIEFEIRDQLITLCEKGKAFLQRLPEVTTLPPELPAIFSTQLAGLHSSALKTNTPQLFDTFVDRARNPETPASAMDFFYGSSFKRSMERVIAQCENATAEDTPKLITELILMARFLNNPETYVFDQGLRFIDSDHEGFSSSVRFRDNMEEYSER